MVQAKGKVYEQKIAFFVFLHLRSWKEKFLLDLHVHYSGSRSLNGYLKAGNLKAGNLKHCNSLRKGRRLANVDDAAHH